VIFGSLFQRVAFGGVSLSGKRESIGTDEVRRIEQADPALLRISGLLLGHRSLAAVKRTLKSILQLPRICSRQFFDRIERLPQLGQLLHILEQFLIREACDSLQLFAQTAGLRFVGLQGCIEAGELLLALLEHSIALLAKFLPQLAIVITRHRADGFPHLLQPLHLIGSLSAIRRRRQPPRTLDQRFFLFHIARVLGINTALQSFR
jgi:hypothetical protein